MSGFFGSSLNANQPQQSTGLFGSLNNTNNAPNTQSSLFGNAASNPNNAQSSQPQQQQQQQGNGLFGNLNAQLPQQPANNLFGGASQNQQMGTQQSGGLFGSLGQSQQGGNSLFGGSTQQPQGNNAFSNTSQQKPSLFGGSILSSAQPQQAPQVGLGFSLGPSQQSQGSFLGSSQQPRLGGSLQGLGELAPRQKSVPEQLAAIAAKWTPQSSDCAFQTYFYNHVGESRAPYFRPAPDEDERKWEEALSRKPGPGYIPVRAVGFEQMAERLKKQAIHLKGYNARLHEINDSLTLMLQKHDLTISIRAADARRKHQVLSQRCVRLAAKVQVLRNRGYAMGGDEEDLKKKLTDLEMRVFDPALGGRSEEIWARMVGVRERCRALQEEMSRMGKAQSTAPPEQMDEAVMKKAAKILDDFASQLAHLRKELLQIQNELGEWEDSSKPMSNGVSRTR